MKVLIVSDYFSTWNIGGASRVLKSQIDGLQNLAEISEIHLISGYPGDDKKESLNIPWSKATYKNILYLPALFLFMLVQRFLFKPNLIHIHQPLSGLLARIAFIGIPCVYHFHSYWYDEKVSHSDGSILNKFFCEIKNSIESLCLKSMDTFIVLSEFSKKKLTQTIGSKDIYKIPGCLDTNQWKAPASKKSLSQENTFKFICVRRLDPRMGIDRLLYAMQALKEENIHLTIVGTGREEENLHRIQEELELKEKVTFAGRVSEEELQTLLNTHHCMTIPTVSIEGFGMIVIEAFAKGLPVIATKTGALIEFSSYKEVFMLFESTEIHDLKKGLLLAKSRFLNQNNLLKQCQETVKHFDMSKISRQYLHIYQKLIC